MVLKLIKSMVEAITRPIQHLIISYLRSLFGFPSLTHHDHVHDDHVTFIIEDSTEVGRNKLLYDSTRVYLYSKTNFELDVGGYKCDDRYQGVKLKWTILVDKSNSGKKSFELRFDEKHRGLVFASYIPYVESKAKEIKSMTLYMHTYSQCSDDISWETKSLDHRSTFETIFMKKEVKDDLTDSLDRFITRKDFYSRVGRPWTINYLLHGLPGTGKTSLVAAMANYLNSDVYNLPLTQVVKSDFNPRRLPLEVMDRSIILVEDIDCSLEGSTVALSQLLSSLGGLYSIDGGVVIFTTNNKEALDKTLLRRMLMHRDIYMGHCCFEGFKTLASNYLNLSDDNHRLYPDIKRLIDGQDVTPGQVAKELMKSQDVDVALEGLVRTLEMIKRV